MSTGCNRAFLNIAGVTVQRYPRAGKLVTRHTALVDVTSRVNGGAAAVVLVETQSIDMTVFLGVGFSHTIK